MVKHKSVRVFYYSLVNMQMSLGEVLIWKRVVDILQNDFYVTCHMYK